MEVKMSNTAGARRGIVVAVSAAICALAAPASTAWAQAAASQLQGEADDVTVGQKHYSPFLNRTYPDRVLWGDTHLHTSYSTDAGMIGNFLGPEEAFRFARGEIVRASVGERARLVRPLDFLVVADHAENLGLAALIEESNPDLLRNAWGRRVHDLVKAGKPMEAYGAWGQEMAKNEDPLTDDHLTRTIWRRIVEASERYNEPGKFTALHGFEWSSSYKANNLHRVVVFRDSADKVRDLIPFSNYDSPDPEKLWEWMKAYEDRTGGRVLAIPHNGNLSNGLMFDDVTLAGKPLTKKYAEQRALWEPLYEVTQIKGDGETHPFLSPNDEFADYETWDQGNLDLSVSKKKDMLQYEYARSALQIGLELEKKLGVNPYKFGMIGSTDSHTALSTAGEDNFFGKHSGAEPGPKRWEHPMAQVGDKKYEGWAMVASGYAGVWAKENTREAIFDAMMRKETYATTGPRMIVRFFGGWDFTEDDAQNRLPAYVGYTKGVPMGGTLSPAPNGKTPTFLVAALKDSLSGNLDRIQIVKGWVDESGKRQEQVYDVVWSGDRKPGKDGKLPPVGNTVDVANATWTNTIGSPEFITVWKDPDFDPKLRAFYYARVIEIPTPRWTAYEAMRFQVKMPKEVPMITQERAYTSPIWYTPKK
jgi:hypothetical protein